MVEALAVRVSIDFPEVKGRTGHPRGSPALPEDTWLPGGAGGRSLWRLVRGATWGGCECPVILVLFFSVALFCLRGSSCFLSFCVRGSNSRTKMNKKGRTMLKKG